MRKFEGRGGGIFRRKLKEDVGENTVSVDPVVEETPIVEEKSTEKSVGEADESILGAEEYGVELDSLNQRMIELKKEEENAYKEFFGAVPGDILPSNREAYFKEFPKELRAVLDQKLSELKDKEKEIEKRKPPTIIKEVNDREAEKERIKKEKSDQLIKRIEEI